MQDKVLTMKFSTPAFALDFEPVNTIINITTASLYTVCKIHVLGNTMGIPSECYV